MHIHVYIYIYSANVSVCIYIYIERERYRERGREGGREGREVRARALRRAHTRGRAKGTERARSDRRLFDAGSLARLARPPARLASTSHSAMRNLAGQDPCGTFFFVVAPHGRGKASCRSLSDRATRARPALFAAAAALPARRPFALRRTLAGGGEERKEEERKGEDRKGEEREEEERKGEDRRGEEKRGEHRKGRERQDEALPAPPSRPRAPAHGSETGGCCGGARACCFASVVHVYCLA